MNYILELTLHNKCMNTKYTSSIEVYEKDLENASSILEELLKMNIETSKPTAMKALHTKKEI